MGCMDAFARQLRYWLEKRELRPTDFARAAGVSAPVVSCWLGGRAPSWRSIVTACDVLGVTLEQFFAPPVGSRK